MTRAPSTPETTGAAGEPIGVLHLRQSEGQGGGADTVLRQITAAQVRRSGAGSDRPGVAPRVAYLHKPSHTVADLVRPLEAAGVAVDMLPGKALIDPRQVRALIILARTHRIRIIHAHDPKSDMLARLIRARLPQLRLVSTLHGWTARGRKGRLYAALDRLALRGFDARVAVSRALQQEALARGLSGVEVIPNGVDTAVWRTSPLPGATAPARPFTVTFAGRLSAEKCPDVMVRVIRRLADALGADRVRVHVAGDGPERQTVEGQAAALGLSGCLCFHGTVDVATLAGLYGQSDAVLLTSRTEGMPMSLLEAGAVGRPVVATRVGGVAELVAHGETGFLAEFGATDTLAAHLLTLAQDPARAAAMGASARQRIGASFSLDRVLLEWNALYRSVVAAPHDQNPAALGRTV